MDEDVEQLMAQNGDDDGDDDDEEWSKPVDDHTVGNTTTHRKPDQTCSTDSVSVYQQNSATRVSKSDHPHTIVHIDVDCFYAQVEMIHNPALTDVPLGIQQKYLLVTCNYPARARGVTKLMGIAEAKKKCPELVLVSGEDLTRYREMSYKISEFLMNYTPCVERLGFDENYLDVTEMVDQRIRGGTAGPDFVGHVYSPHDFEPSAIRPCSCGCHNRLAIGSQIAADIRSALKIELGITCCAGIAHNKLLAKLGGSQHKPNQQTSILPHHGLALITGLDSAHRIPGIGWVTRKRLQTLGVVSVTDLQQFPKSQLEEEFGVAMATTIQELSFGVDPSPVVTYSKPQTMSIEDSFRRCSSEDDARSRIDQLMSNLLPRMQEDGRTPHTLRLTVRKSNKENRYLHRESRQCNLPAGIATKIISGQLDFAKERLVSMAMSLFHKMVDTKQPFHLTLINVAFAKLEEAANNNITSFFNCPATPGSLLSSSERHLEKSEELSAQASDLSENIRVTGESSEKTESVNIPKRKSVSGLSSFFVKKQKLCGDRAVSNTTAAEAGVSDLTRDENQEAGARTENENVSVPPGVDPEVFHQLPVEIQREILQNAAQETRPHTDSLTLPSTSTDSLDRDRCNSSCSQQKEQRPSEGSFFVKQKKPMFSSTKTGRRDSALVPGRSRINCTEEKDATDNNHCVEFESEDISQCQDGDPTVKNNTTKTEVLKFCSSLGKDTFPKPAEITGNSSISVQPKTPGSESPGKTLHSTPKSLMSDSLKNKTSPSKNSSVAFSLSNPKLPVPKGVSPEVFYVLPPELQREVAAEMAMQRHKVTSSAESGNAQQGKSHIKSPAKKVNSMLNYLKKK